MSADATENTEPMALEGDDAGVYARQVAPQQRQKPSATMWFGLGFLVVVALRGCDTSVQQSFPGPSCLT